MNEYCLRLSKPHCESCHKPKKIEIEKNPDGSISYGLERYQGEEGKALELSLADRLQQRLI